MLTPKDIATQLSISTTAVRALIDKGLLKASNVGTGRNKFESKEVESKPIRKGKPLDVRI